MSAQHVKAAIGRWKNVSPEERSERMRSIARARMAKLTPAEKRGLALKMVKARASRSLSNNGE